MRGNKLLYLAMVVIGVGFALVPLAHWLAQDAVDTRAAACSRRWKDSGMPARFDDPVCKVEVAPGRWIPEVNVKASP